MSLHLGIPIELDTLHQATGLYLAKLSLQTPTQLAVNPPSSRPQTAELAKLCQEIIGITHLRAVFGEEVYCGDTRGNYTNCIRGTGAGFVGKLVGLDLISGYAPLRDQSCVDYGAFCVPAAAFEVFDAELEGHNLGIASLYRYASLPLAQPLMSLFNITLGTKQRSQA
jgi:hypothetical protein